MSKLAAAHLILSETRYFSCLTDLGNQGVQAIRFPMNNRHFAFHFTGRLIRQFRPDDNEGIGVLTLLERLEAGDKSFSP